MSLDKIISRDKMRDKPSDKAKDKPKDITHKT